MQRVREMEYQEMEIPEERTRDGDPRREDKVVKIKKGRIDEEQGS